MTARRPACVRSRASFLPLVVLLLLIWIAKSRAEGPIGPATHVTDDDDRCNGSLSSQCSPPPEHPGHRQTTSRKEHGDEGEEEGVSATACEAGLAATPGNDGTPWTSNGYCGSSPDRRTTHRIDDDDAVREEEAVPVEIRYLVPAECTLVMAPSTIPKGGWGIFTLIPRKRGEPVLHGDVVIQLSDLHPRAAISLQTMLRDYLWSASETGGFYEGQHVASVLPGIGMLANGLPPPHHNVLPFVPRVDEGGLTRQDSPGAGAITHYHNYTFFAQKGIEAGGEIFVNYGTEWFAERKASLVTDLRDHPNSPLLNVTRDLDWLRHRGMCLDHLRPSSRSRLFPHAGRSAIAARHLPKGSLVAPVPVLPLRREALQIERIRQDGSRVHLQQLLLNYCFGHANSSILLYPYGPMVNLINHGAASDDRPPYRANVRLQWSLATEIPSEYAHRRSVPDPGLAPFLLELRAIRDIVPGEEVLLDYGPEWINAWRTHVEQWQPPPGADTYAPSYVHDDAIRALRLESELEDHPYPDNIFTSCFYRYSDRPSKDDSRSGAATGAATTTTVPWKQTRGIFELSNLRPCRVLRREHRPKEGTVFTVQVRNRPNLHPREIIPPGVVHIVERVPRHAIRFSDKLYTTDQHLESAFRHEIGLGDAFPAAWLDREPAGAGRDGDRIA